MSEISIYDKDGKKSFKLKAKNDILIKGDKMYVTDDEGKLVEVESSFACKKKNNKITFEA